MSEPTEKTLGGLVRSARDERGWTMRTLAKKAEISASYVSAIEKGKSYPSKEVAGRLASALGLDPEMVESLIDDPLLSRVDWQALIDKAPLQGAVLLIQTRSPTTLFGLKVCVLGGVHKYLAHLIDTAGDDLSAVTVAVEVARSFLAHMTLANMALQQYGTREAFQITQYAAWLFGRRPSMLARRTGDVLAEARALLPELHGAYKCLAELADAFDFDDPLAKQETADAATPADDRQEEEKLDS